MLTINPRELWCSSHSQHLLSSLTLPSGKCGFHWPSSSQLVQPRPTQPRWSRGRKGQVSLCFGSYWTSAFPTTLMIRGDSRRKERRAELLCRWSLVFWPECKLHKARLSPVSLAAPYRGRPGAGHRGALQTGCPRWPVNELEGPHEPVKKG